MAGLRRSKACDLFDGSSVVSVMRLCEGINAVNSVKETERLRSYLMAIVDQVA